MTLDMILEEIKKANTIAVLAHESPDGDAIGSVLAMSIALENMGKNPDRLISEFPRKFKFLPGAEKVKASSDIEKYDLAIALDCSDLRRLDGKEYFENAKKTIVIDHHGTNTMFGDINFVNPVAPACCEILVGIFTYFELDIHQDLGTCILAGIITDTGGFKYQGVTPETFEFTAELLRKGVKVSEIYEQALETRTRSNFELLKRILSRMEILEDGKVTFTYITSQDEEEVNAEAGDHEGLVEVGRGVEGVEVSIFIRQIDKELKYKVSMRSTNDVNVSDICYLFGGGGHPRAAGCLIQGTIEQVKEKILKEVHNALEHRK